MGLINSRCAAEMLATIRATVRLQGEYFQRHAKAVAHSEKTLGLTVLAATRVCPDSAEANGA